MNQHVSESSAQWRQFGRAGAARIRLRRGRKLAAYNRLEGEQVRPEGCHCMRGQLPPS